MKQRFQDIRLALKKKASPQRAKINAWFFKTGPGQYGEGDRFIGVTVPDLRAVAKVYAELEPTEIKKLLYSPIHEERLTALMIVTLRYKKAADPKAKKQWVDFYLKHRKRVNNWDLVDCTAAHILGDYCREVSNPSLLRKLSTSKRHWDRRIAMVGTHAFIRNGDVALTFQFAKQFLKETEDLMHKATGWMLREAGKKEIDTLRKFLKTYGRSMPRTMLRYAIERFSEPERKYFLTTTRRGLSKI